MTQIDDTATALRELTDTITTGEPLPTVLNQICEWVVSLVPDATAASITLIEDEQPRTVVTTDEKVNQLDEAQYRADDGPCLLALRSASTVRAEVAQVRDQWPGFADAATTAGITTVLACALILPDDAATPGSAQTLATVAGALNVWSKRPGAFEPVEAALITMFTGAASAIVLTARRWERAGALTEHLRNALANRDVISTAKGIVMARRGLSSDDAFDWLIDVSQRTNRKIRDLAAVLVEDPNLVEFA